MNSKQVTLALTGASGAPYALRLLRELSRAYDKVFVLVSPPARMVLATECNLNLPESTSAMHKQLCEQFKLAPEKIEVVARDNWLSPVASGSSAPKQMVICPCSTGTLSAIACGASDNLIERAADVVIKEKGQLIVVPRETPLSAIHLDNMLKLAQLGVTIMPAAPGFYHGAETIDDLVNFMVARILDHLGVAQELVPRWGYGDAK